MELMQSHVENDLHEDVELQSQLRHALDVLIDRRVCFLNTLEARIVKKCGKPKTLTPIKV